MDVGDISSHFIIIIIINVLIKVTLNEIRCKDTLQSHWSTLTDSTSLKLKRMSMSQMRAGLAGTEQVILQMSAEGGMEAGRRFHDLAAVAGNERSPRVDR